MRRQGETMLEKLKHAFVRRRSSGTPALRPPSRRALLLWRAVFGIAVFLVLFTVVGFFVVPPVAKHYLVKELSELLDRQVAVEDIDLNPFSMVAVVKGFSVKEPGASDVFVSFSELKVNLQAESIFRRAPILREVKLTNPYAHIVRSPDRRTYNFSDLIEKFSQPKAQPAEESDEEPRFSLNNVQIVNGRIEIDDRPENARHTVREINVAIPFLSNLPYRIEDYVQPSFSARVNETPFSLQGRTKPFQDTLETSVDVEIEKLNIPRYMEYVPLDLAFRVQSGFLDSKVTVSFVRADNRPPLLSVEGSVDLHQFSLAELDGQPLLNLQHLQAPVNNIDVFGRNFAFGTIALQSPEVFVRRDRDGRLNWLAMIPAQDAPDNPPQEKPARPIELSVPEVRIDNGQVHFTDLVPAKAFKTDLSGIEAALRGFTLPQEAPAQAELTFETSFGETVKYAGSLTISPLASEGAVEANRIPLVNYEPYYQDLVLYRLEDGVADLTTRYAFTATDQGPDIKLSGLNLDLAAMRLRKPGEKEDFLSVRTAQLKDASVDLRNLALGVGQFTTRDGFLNLIREADGTINAARILPAPQQAATAGRQGTPWLITLNRADVQKWKVAFTDLALPEPVRIVADEVTLRASEVSNRKNRRGQVALTARVNDTGTVAVKGPVALNPVGAELTVDLKDFGLVPLQPYFADKVNILLTSADLSVTGATKFALAPEETPAIAFDGEMTLTNFASVDKAKSEDFLKWATLFLGGIAYQHDPMQLAINQVALSDFYSRIVIYPEGRLNLQEIMVRPQTQAAPDEQARERENGPAQTAPSGRGGPAPVVAEKTPAAPPATVPAPATPPAAMPPIRIARVTLQGGDVNFTDLFIKPNYSADLSEIGGSVTGLSSQLDTAADVDLRGRFARTAPVDIKGKVNPLVKDLFLDLKVSVRDIELGPFTPYSGKYVGYAIEKGKMTFNVEYHIENRELAAQNQIVVDQLTFGGKVESPEATKLPVLLAVALLKDRNGVIDVNLPISGSLDDPKFSIGGLIIRVIVNLITKAITAPFALLGGLAGGAGGEELSYVEFEAGRAVLTQQAQEKLTALQKGLTDRPALKLDITPRADPERDREGLRRYRFEQQVKAQKLKDLVKQGEAVTSVDEVKIEPQEYEKYLRLAYKEADFPKPRNVIGIVKKLPVEETEMLMLTNTRVTDDDLVRLANERAQVVKDFLTRSEEVALERVFLIAPKVEAPEPDAQLKGSRADFALK
jgi:hypothetical protein